ncbi:MAG: tyrosine-type recombinase/integrase [Hyphomicrobiaceae bacterium]
MASIYQRENGVWWASHTYKGRRERKSLETTDRALAKERLNDWLARRVQAKWSDQQGVKFEVAAERFTKEFIVRKDPGTQKRYAISLGVLGECFLGMALADIDKPEISKFEHYRLGQGVAESTTIRDLMLLSKFFNWALFQGLAEVNPVTAYMLGSDLKDSEPRTRYLSHEEETTILTKAENWPMPRAAFIFAIDTGLREEEQLGIEWAHIDLDKAEVHVPKHLAKRGKARTVPLLPRTVEMLRSLKEPPDGKYVFWRNTKKGPVRYVALYKAITRTAKACNIPNLNYHDLRRTCGCRLLQDHRMSMEVVSKWLGHSSIKVTERHYAFLNVRHLHAALERSPLISQTAKSIEHNPETSKSRFGHDTSQVTRFIDKSVAQDVDIGK